MWYNNIQYRIHIIYLVSYFNSNYKKLPILYVVNYHIKFLLEDIKYLSLLINLIN